jgi:hypothetical protein
LRRTAALVEGLCYVAAGRTSGADGTVRYRLHPWPDDESELPGTELICDRQYVEHRDDLHSAR